MRIYLLLFVQAMLCLYDSNSDVVELTSQNFGYLVQNSSDIWMVEFYAPWCGHCKSLAPEYLKAAKALKGIVRIGAVDMTQHQTVGQPYNITGFPTIKFFGADKSKPVDYNGQRTAQDLVNYLLQQIDTLAKQRLSPQQGQQNSSQQQQQKPKQNTQQQKDNPVPGNNEVQELTQSDFNKLVQKSADQWLVIFYAPWCGHCQQLKPSFESAAKESPSLIKFGKVDCTVHQSVCQEFSIQGYPTLKYFNAGQPEDYNGGRSHEDLVLYANNKYQSFKPPKKVQQMINQQIFDQNCKEEEGLCFIAFLSHIKESGEEQRNQYIKDLQSINEENRGKPLSFIWAQGGENFDLEESLSLSFGFPALIALHFGKMKMSIMWQVYTKDNIRRFIGELLAGKTKLNNIPSVLPKLKETKEYLSSEL